MTRTTAPSRVPLIALALAALLVPALARAEAAVTKTEVTVPFNVTRINGCTGERVALTGELHVTTITTIDATGATHIDVHLVPDHVRGLGLTSGDAYLVTGGQRSHLNTDAAAAPSTFTSTTMFNLHSTGGGANNVTFVLRHTTVNANGDTTVEIVDIDIRCPGS